MIVSDVRELLARCNPATVRYDGGRGGGIPELTAQDIAGAVGMVPAGIGRDLLCWLYGSGRERPASPHRLPAHLDAAIARIMAEQRRALEYAATDAALDLELATALAGAHMTDETRFRVRRLGDDLAVARRRRWPADSHVYPRLRAAVVHELDGADRCDACDGRGIAISGDIRPTCEVCHGSGRKRCSGRQRARWLGVGETTYRIEWRSPYEWLYAMLQDALAEATFRLREAVG